MNRNDVQILLLLCIQNKDFHSHFVSCSFSNLKKKMKFNRNDIQNFVYDVFKTIVFIHIFQIYEELIEIINNFINHNMNQSSNISCTIPGWKLMEIFLACNWKKYSMVKKHVYRTQTLQQYDFQY